MLLGSGAITDGETDPKNASVDGPLAGENDFFFNSASWRGARDYMCIVHSWITFAVA
jgi:hypothetical protein